MSPGTSLFFWIESAVLSTSSPLERPALYWKGHVSSTTNWTLLARRDRANAWWSTRLWAREPHPIFVRDISWRRVFSSRQPLPRHIQPTSPAAPGDARLVHKVSLHRDPPSSLLARPLGLPTNAMATFSRAPLNLTITFSSLSCFPGFGGPAGASSYRVRGGLARTLIGQGAQLPRTLLERLGWSGSAHSRC